mgnify:CR=1 FL=1
MLYFKYPLYILLSFLIPSLTFGGEILLQSTTSTNNSGFYEYILPKFKDETGLSVKVVAVGTGQAIKNAENCDADVLIVHARKAEEEFVASGGGIKRYDLMYNDFVVVGPVADPAQIQQTKTISEALTYISRVQPSFISRGDNSGTHKKELELWGKVPISVKEHSGKWYKETGSGMGTTLNIAAELDAYTISDRATWLTFKNKKALKILFEGDPLLFNQYGVVLVNPEKCPKTKTKKAKNFLNWLLSKNGQSEIENYTVNGVQLFYPNAIK